MKDLNTISAQWEALSATVMPKGVSLEQMQEMRRLFYAGALAMLHLQLVIGEDSFSEDAAIAVIEGWHEECRLFGQQILNGTA